MNSVLEYKGYHAKIIFDVRTMSLRGRIEGITDLIDFESDSIDQIEEEFHSAVDDYLVFCEEVGKAPEKEYKGSFNIRIQPDLHRQLAVYAAKHGISLNAGVEQAIVYYLENHASEPVQETKTVSETTAQFSEKTYNLSNYSNTNAQETRKIESPFLEQIKRYFMPKVVQKT